MEKLDKIYLTVEPYVKSMVRQIYSYYEVPFLTSEEQNTIINHLTKDDLTQDVLLYCFEFYRGYKGNDYLHVFKKYAPLFIRHLARKELKRELAQTEFSREEKELVEYTFLSLKWVLVDPDEVLKPYERYLLYLYYTRCYTYKELTHLLNLSEKTLKTDIKEIRDRCQTILSIN